MLAGEEVDSIVHQQLAGTLPTIGPKGPPRVRLTTGNTLASELQSLAALVAPLSGPKLAAALRRGIQDLFFIYTMVGGLAGG